MIMTILCQTRVTLNQNLKRLTEKYSQDHKLNHHHPNHQKRRLLQRVKFLARIQRRNNLKSQTS